MRVVGRWVLVLSVVVGLVACQPSSTPDSFNGGETLARPPVVQPPNIWSVVPAMLADGSTVTYVASGFPSFEGNSVPSTAALMRHRPDGSADPAFGDGGVVPLPWPSDDLWPPVLVPDADGSVMLLRARRQQPGSDRYDLVIERILADGTIEPFQVLGPILPQLLDFSGASGFGFRAEFDAAGRLVVMPERSVIRLLPDGSVDPSFNGGQPVAVDLLSHMALVGNEIAAVSYYGGSVTWISEDGASSTASPTTRAYSVVTDGAGGAVAVTAWEPLRMVRFVAGGVVDAAYGDAGVATLPGVIYSPHHRAVAVGGGRLAVEATIGDRGGRRVVVVVGPTGVQEMSWAGDGTLDLAGDAASTPPHAAPMNDTPLASNGARLASLVVLQSGVEHRSRLAVFDAATGAVLDTVGDEGTVPLARSSRTLPHQVRAVVAGDDGFVVLDRWRNPDGSIAGVGAARVTSAGVVDEGFAGPAWSARGIDTALVAVPTGYVAASQSRTQVDWVYLSKLQPDGSLDLTFSGDGWHVYYAATNHVALAAESDGSVVVATLREQVGTSSSWLRRFGPDGTEVAARDLGSINSDDYDDAFNRSRLTVDAAGRLVLATRWCEPAPNPCHTIVRRFLPDLSDDLSFGAGGTGTVVLPDASAARYERIDDLAVTAGGQIVVAGVSGGVLRVVRLDDTGAFDAGYGTAGVVRTRVLQVRAVAVDDQGRVVVAGTDRSAPLSRAGVARLDGAGVLDEEFVDGGVRWFPASEASVWTGVDVAPNGRIALAGERAPGEPVTVLLLGGPPPED